MSEHSHIGCVRTVPIFRDLPHETLLRLSEAVRPREFGRGELIASAGDSIDNIMIVAAGKLRMVHVSPSGREQIVREVGPGEFIGELGLAMSARYDGDVVAAEETLACVLPISAVREAISSSPEAAMRLIEALVRRLARAEQVVGDLGARDVSQRLAAELVRAARGACGCSGCSGKGGSNVVVLPGPWSEMAARLGTTPESLSRRLRALEEEGLIARPAGGEAELERDGSRRVVILDIERLEEIAGL
ncbi:MAG: Crp/Fnr family transcriptional regulator [Firmicutes bacterium]|nr:Crp/Fnr family transcriptional regulator [Bacillota bacterium]